MKTNTIRSSWMPEYGYRLDCSPYLSGALETKLLLEKLSVRKDPLRNLTQGHDGGIFNGPQFSRTFVDSEKYGVPFLGSGSMRQADLSDLPFLSRTEASTPKLRHLKIQPGMSLISCSGTIGNMVYARPEMVGMWTSQHIMKVCPDPAKILPGYLYTYLSSKFGLPLVISGTYGSIIQSIEPHHILDIPVPRIGNALERKIHGFVEEAAQLRTRASRRKKDAIREFERIASIPAAKPLPDYDRPFVGKASSASVVNRLDATYYVGPYAESRTAMNTVAKSESAILGDIAEVFIPTIFKREYATDRSFGHPYITGADVFCINADSSEYLLAKVARDNRLLLENGMIVLHEAGQRYGLIGRGVMIGRSLTGFACTNNMVRVKPHESRETGYIYSVLASEHGVRLLKREAAGSSIPHLDEGRVKRIRIPWLKEKDRFRISDIALNAREDWDRANELEHEAQEELVKAVQKS